MLCASKAEVLGSLYQDMRGNSKQRSEVMEVRFTVCFTGLGSIQKVNQIGSPVYFLNGNGIDPNPEKHLYILGAFVLG